MNLIASVWEFKDDKDEKLSCKAKSVICLRPNPMHTPFLQEHKDKHSNDSFQIVQNMAETANIRTRGK